MSYTSRSRFNIFAKYYFKKQKCSIENFPSVRTKTQPKSRGRVYLPLGEFHAGLCYPATNPVRFHVDGQIRRASGPHRVHREWLAPLTKNTYPRSEHWSLAEFRLFIIRRTTEKRRARN